MLENPKRQLKKLAKAVGIEISRARPQPTDRELEQTDAFIRQKMILAGIDSPVIFDVGANVGTTVKRYRSLFPAATIYAFEPFPESFKTLQEVVGGDPQIHAFELGLGSRKETVQLRANESAATNSVLPTHKDGAAYWGSGKLETVSVVTINLESLDDFCTTNGIDKIGILKIDTQGTELPILKGSQRMLADHQIKVIYLEVILVPTYEGQPQLYEVLAFLDQFDFVVSGIYEPTYSDSNRLLQIDIVFIRA